MLNYNIKNLKAILKPSDGEQLLIARESSAQETIITGGHVCNVHPDLAAFFNLILYNNQTEDIIYLYENIEIAPTDYLTLSKISLSTDQSLITYVTTDTVETDDDYLNVTINYFDIINYNNGLLNVTFNNPLVYNQEPVNPVLYTPKWRVVGTGTWYDSSLTLTDEITENAYVPLEEGDYEIEFSEVIGYVTPENLSVTIQKLKLTEVTITYQISDAIVIFKCNQIDANDSFGWRVVGGSTYYIKDQYVVLPVGTHEIEFKDVDGFETPENIQISLPEDQHLYIFYIEYIRPKGYLTVTLSSPSIHLGRSHQYNLQWYVKYPDYVDPNITPPSVYNSITNLYNSGDRVPIVVDEGYELVIPQQQVQDQMCFSAIQNNIIFDITHAEEKQITVDMQQVNCYGIIPSTKSFVNCVSEAIDPGPPPDTIIDETTISPVLIGYTDFPRNIVCDGKRIWKYEYTIGSEKIYWTHTYKIVLTTSLVLPAEEFDLVDDISQATDPGPPENILDVCGRTITPTLVGYADTENSRIYNGYTRVWTYRYTSCNKAKMVDWLFTYLKESWETFVGESIYANHSWKWAKSDADIYDGFYLNFPWVWSLYDHDLSEPSSGTLPSEILFESGLVDIQVTSLDDNLMGKTVVLTWESDVNDPPITATKLYLNATIDISTFPNRFGWNNGEGPKIQICLNNDSHIFQFGGAYDNNNGIPINNQLTYYEYVPECIILSDYGITSIEQITLLVSNEHAVEGDYARFIVNAIHFI